MSFFFPKRYGAPQQPKAGIAGFGVALIVHGLVVIAAIVGFAHREQLESLAKPIAVSLLETPRPPPEKPKLPPPPKKQVTPVAPPLPVATPLATTPTAAPTGVLSPPPVTAPAAPVAPPAELPLVEARFDADYLSNPKPNYPPFSRRMGETGTVYLRVQVSPDGHALQVDIKKSSGFARLDQSAQETVQHWKFVPARRGNTPVPSWVVVPIVFSLS